MQLVSYVVEYDENSCAWLAEVNRPSFRIALEHGMVVQMVPVGDQTLHIPWLPKPGGTA